MREDYSTCYAAVRQYEGGNDDDPRDPGGRTSRGIIQREYDSYRLRKGLPQRDVWKADESEIAEIYQSNYWSTQHGDVVTWGVDEDIFDYGVHSGIGRSQKVLRRCLHMADNAPWPDVQKRIDSLNKDQVAILINSICDERLAFLKTLKIWSWAGNGFTRRVASVRDLSVQLMNRHPEPTIDSVPVDAKVKGQHTEPKGAKRATTAAGGGGGAAAAGTWHDWIAAHHFEAVAIGMAVIVAIALAIYAINRWHQKRTEAAPPNWTPPQELKPQGA